MNDYEVTKGRTYQYFEGEALYSFGYGLSYTSFAYSDMKIAKNQESITISATVKNTGDYEGDEVVQLYVKDVKSSVQRPLKQLVGFKRTSLAIGESKSISFEVPIQQLMFWDEKCNEWHFEKGAFEFMIGASSSDIRLKKTCKVK